MITCEYVQMMAAYNRWQNTSVYDAADSLSDAARREDRGAFFGSIHATLNHVLWGDQIWMQRFADTAEPAAPGIPESIKMVDDWVELKRQRQAFDEVIIEWGTRVEAGWFEGDLSWFSGAMNRDVTRPKAMLVTHMFNHQTHHRGQVNAMLTAAGAKPDDTDIPFQKS